MTVGGLGPASHFSGCSKPRGCPVWLTAAPEGPQQPQDWLTSAAGPSPSGCESHPDLSLLQCQDLLSQTSSPLSQNDSCTARSADLLLPPGDTGRRRHDSLPDPVAPSRVERFRIQVRQEGVLQAEVPSFLWTRQGLLTPAPRLSPVGSRRETPAFSRLPRRLPVPGIQPLS